MYISKNFIYKDCMRKMTNWEECPELNEYRLTKMAREFVIVVCKACESSNPKKVHSNGLMMTTAGYTNTYAGNFMHECARPSTRPPRWLQSSSHSTTKTTQGLMTYVPDEEFGGGQVRTCAHEEDQVDVLVHAYLY
ncbi:hypothetical protein FAVG1_13216 [Fusarium avenaceum]|nr:hypothetical protein FAVG1_13216 [Fusarium avenaceum]